MKPYFPVPIRNRRFKEPTNVRPVARIDPGTHSGVGSGGIGKAQSAKGLFDGTVVPVVTLPCSNVEAPATFFVKHHCTNRKDKFLSYATFLCVTATLVQRQDLECL